MAPVSSWSMVSGKENQRFTWYFQGHDLGLGHILFLFKFCCWGGLVTVEVKQQLHLALPKEQLTLPLFYSCLFPCSSSAVVFVLVRQKSHKCSDICMKNACASFSFISSIALGPQMAENQIWNMPCNLFCVFFYSHPKEWKQCQMIELINANFRKDYLGSTHM